jgi:hypothetical protein
MCVWIFWKSVMKIQVLLILDKTRIYATWRPIYIFYHISLVSSYNEKCFWKMLHRKSKPTFCAQWLLFENRTAFEKMWKNIVEWGRPLTTIRRMCILCWMTKATNTHTHTHTHTHHTHALCVIIFALAWQLWLHEYAPQWFIICMLFVFLNINLDEYQALKDKKNIWMLINFGVIISYFIENLAGYIECSSRWESFLIKWFWKHYFK